MLITRGHANNTVSCSGCAKTTSARFELALPEGNRLAIYRVNHFATKSHHLHCIIQWLYSTRLLVIQALQIYSHAHIITVMHVCLCADTQAIWINACLTSFNVCAALVWQSIFVNSATSFFQTTSQKAGRCISRAQDMA